MPPKRKDSKKDLIAGQSTLKFGSQTSKKREGIETKEDAAVATKVRKIDERLSTENTESNDVANILTSIGVVGSTGLHEILMAQLTDPGWKAALQNEFSSTYFKECLRKVEADMKIEKVFPPSHQIFAAFQLTPLHETKVVIIGQDPYHDDNQAHGLCFSVNPPTKPPPSLVNMYTELEADISGFKRPNHGNLTPWAKQGVLLLNATLTVIAHKANSQQAYGWQTFTDNVIKYISKNLTGVVFLLWGGFAQKKAKLIDGTKHHIIQSAHPSPLSVTKWRGCKVFSKTNALLDTMGKKPIDWSL